MICSSSGYLSVFLIAEAFATGGNEPTQSPDVRQLIGRDAGLPGASCKLKQERDCPALAATK
jgi:hypothetical protein